MSVRTRFKLRLIKRLLWWADGVMCSLPGPAAPEGSYYEIWADLGNVHSSIGNTYSESAGHRRPA